MLTYKHHKNDLIGEADKTNNSNHNKTSTEGLFKDKHSRRLSSQINLIATHY